MLFFFFGKVQYIPNKQTTHTDYKEHTQAHPYPNFCTITIFHSFLDKSKPQAFVLTFFFNKNNHLTTDSMIIFDYALANTKQ